MKPLINDKWIIYVFFIFFGKSVAIRNGATLSSVTECSGENGNQGTCLSRLACSKQQGNVIGVCGLFRICCALSSNSIKTDSKVAVFINPPIPADGTEVIYNININNDNVCQMRVDFEIFSLSQPTTIPPNPTTTSRGYSCQDDEFRISGYLPGDDIPSLCGENTGQHVYTRVNSSLNVRSITINFRIVSRNNRQDLSQASWRIKVTQLECFNMFRKVKDKTTLNILSDIKSVAFRDEYYLAPPGCLQYYPERSGTVESFNFYNGGGRYFHNLFYSMCFRRQLNICGVRFTVSQFDVAYIDISSQTDSFCISSSNGIENGDYLFIPEAQTSEDVIATKWCGNTLNSLIVAMTPPGPLYIHFKSDDLVTNGIDEIGFRLNYNLMNNCD